MTFGSSSVVGSCVVFPLTRSTSLSLFASCFVRVFFECFCHLSAFSVLIPLSTRPFGECINGVPYISLMIMFLQKSLNSFTVTAVTLPVLVVCDMPFKFMYCSKKFFAVLLVGVSQMHAAVHLLYRSTDTNMNNRLCLNCIGTMISKWISWFGFLVGGK